MSAPLVIFAIGNPSRGDDALGPEICGRLAAWLENEGLNHEVELIEDFQLQIEHALDLRGRQLELFIDAGERTPAPFIFARLAPSTAMTHTSHALEPATVLQVYRQTEGCEPPQAFVLCVRGENFELGAGLSQLAMAYARAAFSLLQELCLKCDEGAWQKRAAT